MGLLAGPLLGTRATAADAPPVARVTRRWPTGNARLFPPAVAGERILCAGDRTLASIDPAAGAPSWLVEHGLPEGAVFRPRADAATAVCGGRRELGAWRLDSGAGIWRCPARQQFGVPCLHGDRILVGDGHELRCLALADGTEIWRFAATADTQISYAPAAAGATVFVGPGDGRLHALSLADGAPRWTLDGMATWQYLRQLHVGDGILVAGSYKETLHGIDIATGRQLWEFNAGNFINSHHLADGVAYLWSPTGWLYAIDAASGQVRWRLRTTDYRGGRSDWAALLAELTTRDGRLYALDLGHVLHVLDTVSGKEVARLRLPEPVRPYVLPLGGRRIACGAENGELLLVEI
ncbi:MAG: PQQ-binding-like beta-propeller repeat protein [Pseudomonadota bacterium]